MQRHTENLDSVLFLSVDRVAAICGVCECEVGHVQK